MDDRFTYSPLVPDVLDVGFQQWPEKSHATEQITLIDDRVVDDLINRGLGQRRIDGGRWVEPVFRRTARTSDRFIGRHRWQVRVSEASFSNGAEAAVAERSPMSRIKLGIICGLVFGAIDIGIMLPMSFPDKKAAITAAFIARFGIGFVIGAARLPWPGWAVGLCFGLLLSIPDALITKAYGPIIGMGAIGGTIVGILIGRFGR